MGRAHCPCELPPRTADRHQIHAPPAQSGRRELDPCERKQYAPLMTNTTSPNAVSGLSELAAQYRAVLCDVWGVIHNGVRSFAPACDALARYRAQGGTVVLITN